MKFIVFACLLALALAAPRPEDVEKPEKVVEVEPEVDHKLEASEVVETVEEAVAEPAVAEPIKAAEPVKVAPRQPKVDRGDVKYEHANILKDERSDSGDGNFNYAIEADNGIEMNVVGTPGAEKGQSNMEGFYRMSFPDGTVAEVRFVANELGFQPISDLIPTPHPLPAHVHELLRIAEEQRAAGITFE